MSGWLAVFAKLPRPGGVKTRMCPPLDWETAARLYEAMLDDVLAESERAALRAGLELVVAVDSAEGAALLSRRGPASARFVEQVGAGLARRMTHLARSARAAGATRLLMRGSDSPGLVAAALCDAADAVAPGGAAEVAFSPAPDGGYNLVALSGRALDRGFSREVDLFDHAMSNGRELEATRSRAADASLRTELLAPSRDIDRAEDLACLEPWRGAGAEAPCPATLSFVEQHALWPGGRPASSPSKP